MKKYNYSKKKFITGISIIILILLSASAYLICIMNSYYTRFGISGMILCFGIYIVLSLLRDYHTPIKIYADYFTISVYGKIYPIYFNNVLSIKHFGVSGLPFADSLIITQKNGKKIGIDFVFEDYLELWTIIIERSTQSNSHIIIKDSVKKRMKKLR